MLKAAMLIVLLYLRLPTAIILEVYFIKFSFAR